MPRFRGLPTPRHYRQGQEGKPFGWERDARSPRGTAARCSGMGRRLCGALRDAAFTPRIDAPRACQRAAGTRVGHTEGRADPFRPNDMDMWLIALAYLVGGVPFALLLARRIKGTDVRYSGSGNVGAANVLRTTGIRAAVPVLVLDFSKGFGIVFLAQRLGIDSATQGIIAVAAVTGHVFPVWLRFRGGKGVATACGAFAALTPTAALAAVFAFAVIVWRTRYVSVGSMVAAVLLPPLAYATGAPGPIVLSSLGVAVLVLARHRPNAQRLSSGREIRLGEPLS